MERSLTQRLRILVLGVFFTLGVVLSAAHADEMAMNPLSASDTCLAQKDGKSGCDLGEDGHSAAATCVSVCPLASAAIMASITLLAEPGAYEPRTPARSPRAGLSPAPDPSPPKAAGNS